MKTKNVRLRQARRYAQRIGEMEDRMLPKSLRKASTADKYMYFWSTYYRKGHDAGLPIVPDSVVSRLQINGKGWAWW